MISVLVADDEELVRTGLRMVLGTASDIRVVSEAADGAEAVAQAAMSSPDVVLMDIRMPHRDGLDATRELLRVSPPPRVIVLTTFDADEYVYEALRAGASAFLLKDVSPSDLITAVRTVAAGEAVLHPTVTRKVVEAFAHGRVGAPGRPDATMASLTEREREIFRLLGMAMSNAEIARSLVVSEATVKTHVAHVLAKLDLRDRAQAVVRAYESGVVRPGEAGPAREARDRRSSAQREDEGN